MSGNEIFQMLYMGFFTILISIVVLIWILVMFFGFVEKLRERFSKGLDNPRGIVRKAYVMKLDDENVLKDVVLNDSSEDVRLAALDRIDNPLILRMVADGDDGVVSRIAKNKLKAHRDILN